MCAFLEVKPLAVHGILVGIGITSDIYCINENERVHEIGVIRFSYVFRFLSV